MILKTGDKVLYRPEPKLDAVVATVADSNRSGLTLHYSYWLNGLLESNCATWIPAREAANLQLAK